MRQRHPSLLEMPIAFAHRGARAHAPENTLEAFTLALRLGATGLETDAWLTGDGHVVLDHDGTVRLGFRKRRISDVGLSSLPGHVPALPGLFAAIGTDYHLSIDLKDPAVVPAISRAAADSGFPTEKLWLCSPDIEVLIGCRDSVQGANLVHSTRTARLKSGVEMHCLTLREEGLGTLNLHHDEWNGGTVVLCHRFGIKAFAWDCQHAEHVSAVLAMGIDAVYGDRVDLLVDCFREVVGSPPAGGHA